MTWLPVRTLVKPAHEPVLIGQLRDWLELTDNSSDAKLIGLIMAATRLVQKHTGLRLVTQTVEMRRAAFDDEMELPTGPVQAISSVQYLDTSNVLQTVSAGSYSLISEEYRSKIYLGSGASWPSVYSHPAAVIVNAVVGFGGINDQPEDIRLAILMLCAQWFDTRSAVTEKTVAEMPNGVAALLTDFSPSPLG